MTATFTFGDVLQILTIASIISTAGFAVFRVGQWAKALEESNRLILQRLDKLEKESLLGPEKLLRLEELVQNLLSANQELSSNLAKAWDKINELGRAINDLRKRN